MQVKFKICFFLQEAEGGWWWDIEHDDDTTFDAVLDFAARLVSRMCINDSSLIYRRGRDL